MGISNDEGVVGVGKHNERWSVPSREKISHTSHSPPIDRARCRSKVAVRLPRGGSDTQGYVEPQHPKFLLGLSLAKANDVANGQLFRQNGGEHCSEE